jgi:hypothetical protein
MAAMVMRHPRQAPRRRQSGVAIEMTMIDQAPDRASRFGGRVASARAVERIAPSQRRDNRTIARSSV